MTKNDIIEMAKQAGIEPDTYQGYLSSDELASFAKLVAAKENKACLEIANDCTDAGLSSSVIANCIRVRGQK